MQRTNRMIENFLRICIQSQIKLYFGLKHSLCKRVERKFYLNSMENCCAVSDKEKREV